MVGCIATAPWIRAPFGLGVDRRLKRLDKGLYGVMVTPFDDQLRIDHDGVKSLVRWYEEAGMNGFFANCATSEMYDLDPEERLNLTKTVVEVSSKPVVSTGTFSASPEENIAFIKKMHQTGVEAVVLITSILVGKGEDDDALWTHIEEIVKGTPDIPLGLYECPSPYKRLITPRLLKRIASTGRFVYLKDTSCDAQVVHEKIRAAKGSILGLYNAHTPDALFTMQHNGAGLSPIGSNFYPELYAYLIAHANKKSRVEEIQLVNEFLLRNDKIIGAGYPNSAKYFMKLRGLDILPIARRTNKQLSQKQMERLQEMHSELKELAIRLKIELA